MNVNFSLILFDEELCGSNIYMLEDIPYHLKSMNFEVVDILIIYILLEVHSNLNIVSF